MSETTISTEAIDNNPTDIKSTSLEKLATRKTIEHHLGQTATLGETRDIKEGISPELVIERLEQCGLVIDHERAGTVLSDPQLFDKNLGEIRELIGIEVPKDKEKEIALKANEVGVQSAINEIARLRLQDELGKVDPEQLQIIEGHINGLEPRRAFEAIIKDKDSSFYQGYHWNVLLSQNLPVVLKFTKYGEHHFNSADNDQENFKTIQQVLGEEFMVGHIQISLNQTNRRMLLQEKLDPRDWNALSPNAKGSTEKLAELAKSNPESSETLKRFLRNVSKLDGEAGLTIDVLGNNVWFRVNDKGILEIKLIDYGVFDQKDSDNNKQVAENIKRGKDFLSALGEL